MLMLTLVVFLVAIPSGRWSWAVAISIGAVALLVAGTTAGAPWAARSVAARLLAFVSIIVVAATIGELMPRFLTATYGAVIAGAVPLVIARGLWRHVHRRGVTLQAVAGALVIYLSVGLAFAWIITLVAQIAGTPYFAQHTSGTLGDRVYFSFTALTTTGFGDFSAGTPVGHALTVIEMLCGQLYLATVIGVLIGSYVGRAAAPEHDSRRTEEWRTGAGESGAQRRLLHSTSGTPARKPFAVKNVPVSAQ